MYIEVDKKTGELEINLPGNLVEYRRAAEKAIKSEFAFEPLNLSTLRQMNRYLCEWFDGQGISLPENPEQAMEKGEKG